jgi:hypothetical protein
MLQRLQDGVIRPVCVYQKGQWVERNSIVSGVDVPLPQGGTVFAYPYAGGEPLFGSLSPGPSRVPPVEMLFTPFPAQLHSVLRENALRVLGGDIDAATAADAFYDTVESDPRRWLTLTDEVVPIPKMWVRAVGRTEGRAARYSCWLTPAMWNVGGYLLTSVALAVAVRKVLRGEVRERGVITAETAFEPLPFLNEVASLIPDSLPDGKLLGDSFEWLE